MILKLIIVASCVGWVLGGCRDKRQESNLCESICHKDADSGKMMCELRGAIILPDLENIVASRQRVRKTIHRASLTLPFQRVKY